MNSAKKDTKPKKKVASKDKKTNKNKKATKDKKHSKNTYKFKFYYNANKFKKIDDVVMMPENDEFSLNLLGGDEDIVKSEISVNDILYIGLFNEQNSICYYITMLQRLHSSKTLNQLISEKQFNEKHPLYAVQLYSKINQKNKQNTFLSIQANLSKLFSEVFEDSMLGGGEPFTVLKAIFIPLLIESFGLQHTKTILCEMNVEPLNLGGKIGDGFLSDNMRNSQRFFKDVELDNKCKKLYSDNVNQLVDYIPYSKQPFVICNLNIFFNDDEGQMSSHGGHAVNVIKDDVNDFYIIDDSVNIRKIENYIASKANRFRMFEFKDIDDENVRILKTKIGRYEDVNARIYKTIINFPKNGMSGGVEDEEEFTLDESPSTRDRIIEWYNNLQSIEKILFTVFAILLVIFTIVIIVRLMQILKLSIQKKRTTEKYKRVENKIAKIEKRLGIESNRQKDSNKTVRHEKQDQTDFFTKQRSKKEIIKEVIPDVAEVGLNIAERFNLIDLANKNLMNQIIRKTSGH